MMRKILFGGLFLLLLPLVVQGQTYLMRKDVLSEAGVEASSASYVLYGSAAQPVIGLSSSASYIESAGFWHMGALEMPGVQEGIPRISVLPRVYSLNQNFPNPAADQTTIQYALPKESRVALRVYDVAGRLVTTLVDATEKAGYRRAVWDGKDSGGRAVAAGTYFYRLNAGTFSATRKLLLLR